MPMNEAAAASVIQAVLLSGEYGGVLTPAAQALVQKVGSAAAKCIGHMILNNTVSTTVTGVVAGATPSTPGAFAGTGTGTVGGLVRGSAAANTGLAGEIVTELLSSDFGGAVTPAARLQLNALADAIAVFADYVMANATVTTTDAGAAVPVNLNGPSTGTGTGAAV